MENFETLGLRLDIIIVGCISIVLVTTSIVLFFVRKKRGEGFYDSLVGLFLGLCTLFTVFILVIFTVALVPFQVKYFNVYQLEGVVHLESNNFIEGSGSLSDMEYVVNIEGVDNPVVFNDSRVLSVNNQKITASCTFGWVPYGEDVLYCNVKSFS